MIDEFRLERKPFDKPEATVADVKVEVHHKAEPESNPANPENAVITQLADALSGAVGSKTNDDMRRFFSPDILRQGASDFRGVNLKNGRFFSSSFVRQPKTADSPMQRT